MQNGRQKIQSIHTMWVWEPLVRCLLSRGNTRNVDKMKRSYTIKLYNPTQISTKRRYFSTALVHSCVIHCVRGTEQMLWTDFLCVLTL